MSNSDEFVYICDPEKNTVCSKTSCGYINQDGQCYHTTFERFAKENSKRIPREKFIHECLSDVDII